jgi:Acyl-CoA reductase (LuxC)
MQLQQRINAFVRLGMFLNELSMAKEGSEMARQIQLANANNGWFTEDNLRFACKSWSTTLSEENLIQWLSNYTIKTKDPKTIAVVMAGNIPLVGFHDFLSVLISGNNVLVKLSSNDKHLLPYLAKQLVSIEAGFKDHISFTESKLENFDAVIATGSNNTTRYFDYYFGKYPNIIRKNRNSVAVLTGTETTDQLESLADDIFRYFGLGCRNVSKIYIPKDYDFDPFFKGMYSWKHVINDNKYINNYDYNKAVYLMSLFDILDNEFLLLKEDKGFSSPISVVFYEYYDSPESLTKLLSENEENIQCVISEQRLGNTIPFGKAQTPNLRDYADGIDTLKFLLEL